MKNIIVGGLIIGAFAFTGTALAANVGKQIVKSVGLWGFVDGRTQSWVYRLEDKENKNICYVAYHGVNSVPDMECVHIK